jgi:hypothetical protein
MTGKTTRAFLAENPRFNRVLTQFTALHKAAEVIADVQPSHGDVAGEYLRALADNLMRNFGLREDLLQAFTAAVLSVSVYEEQPDEPQAAAGQR